MFFVGTFIYVSHANAATIEAESCSRAHVQTAIDAASDGDVVVVPAGDCEWTDRVEISGKGITLQGAGIGQTNITNGRSAAYSSLLAVDTDATHSTRITGFTFKGKATNNSDYHLSVGVYGRQKFRIDHCKFQEGYHSGWKVAAAICIYNNPYGVIDHCIFDDAAMEVIQVKGDGSDAWSRDSDPGTDNAIYIEDCTITQDCSGITVGAAHAIACFRGARVVFRYNTVDHYNFDAHGREGHPCSTRWYEIYENSCTVDAGRNQADWMYLRGGSGVIFNNVMTNNGVCGGIRLTEHNIDRIPARCCCSHPCPDQIGRGKDQASEPLYIWGNSFNGGSASVSVSDYADPGVCEAADKCNQEQNCRDFIQENRDYYLSQKPGYTPYQYPHPLTQAQLAPPSNLRLVLVE